MKVHSTKLKGKPTICTDTSAAEVLELTGASTSDLAVELMRQASDSLWRTGSAEKQELTVQAAFDTFRGIAPQDTIEGMIATQMIATHNAALECFRRAHLREQTFEGRQMALNYANKMVRSYAMLVEALARHRGKGQQTVRVEHVHVHSGGQAIVGAVNHPGGGVAPEIKDQGDARQQLAHAPEPALRRPDTQREPVPVAGGEWEAALPDARRRGRQRRT